MIPFTPMKVQCECGRRLGLHRYGTDQCPNPAWRPGGSQPEFLSRTFRAHYADLVEASPFTTAQRTQ